MKEKDESFKYVEACYNKSYNDLSPLFKKFNEYENLYWFHMPKSKNSAKSNVFDPLAYELVEHNVAHLYAQTPSGAYTAKEPGDIPNEPIINSLIKYQINKPDIHFRKILVDAGRTAVIFGTAFVLLGWKYERKFNKLMNKWVTVMDDPAPKALNIYNCYPDTDATSPADMQYFIHDEYLTIEELEATNAISQGNKRYENLEELKEAVQSGVKATRNQYQTNATLRQSDKTNSNAGKDERILIRRCYTRDRWISIAPDYGLTIEDRSNPYYHGELPIHTLINIDYPGVLYGIGEIAPVKSLMIAQNQILNMRMDNVKMILEPSFKAKNSALKYKHTWKMGRNQIMVVDNENDIMLNAIPDVTGNTFQATTNYILDAINRRTGRTDFLSRTDTEGNRTATELRAMVGEQNARLRYKANNIDEFIKSLMNQWLQLNQQFIKKSRVIKITGAEAVEQAKNNREAKTTSTGELFFNVDPESIQGSYDYIVETSSTRNIEVNQETQNLNTAIQLLERYAPILQQAENTKVNFKPILETILKNLGVKSTDNILENIQQNEAQTITPSNEAISSDGGMGASEEILGGREGYNQEQDFYAE
jgi:hypothetical protein